MRVEGTDGFTYEMLTGPSEFVRLDKEALERHLMNGELATNIVPQTIEDRHYTGFRRLTLRWPTQRKESLTTQPAN